MFDGGYVKIWRCIDNNPIATKPNYLVVWMFVLRFANHKDKSIIWNNKKTLIKRGSFITSAQKISKGTGVARGTVERILKYLKNEEMIEELITQRFRLISVMNYDKYQKSEELNEEQVRNKRGTSEEQVDTTKNDKNDKNDNSSSKKERKRSEPRKDIDFLLKSLESVLVIIDEPKTKRRQWAKHFLDSKIPEIFRRKHNREPTAQESINSTIKIFQLARNSGDKFIKTNSSSLRWVYNNIGKILNSKSSEAQDVAFIS